METVTRVAGVLVVARATVHARHRLALVHRDAAQWTREALRAHTVVAVHLYNIALSANKLTLELPALQYAY